MLRLFVSLVALSVLALSLAGCAKSETTSVAADPRYLLPSAPAGAVGVNELKEKVKSGDQVSVSGRVGGGIKPWIDGRAAFVLVDSFAPMPSAECGPECAHCAAEIAASSLVVKFVDESGKTIGVDSRQLLGVQEEEEVVVNGVASRDEQGNVALVATGIFIKR
jgi:hypothetical protein